MHSLGTRCAIMPRKEGVTVETPGASVGRRGQKAVWRSGSLRHLSGHAEQVVRLGLRTVILANDVAFGKLEGISKMVYPNPFIFIFKFFIHFFSISLIH